MDIYLTKDYSQTWLWYKSPKGFGYDRPKRPVLRHFWRSAFFEQGLMSTTGPAKKLIVLYIVLKYMSLIQLNGAQHRFRKTYEKRLDLDIQNEV